MQNVWVLASLWVGLALVATLLAIWFKISTALTEIVVGTVALCRCLQTGFAGSRYSHKVVIEITALVVVGNY